MESVDGDEWRASFTCQRFQLGTHDVLHSGTGKQLESGCRQRFVPKLNLPCSFINTRIVPRASAIDSGVYVGASASFVAARRSKAKAGREGGGGGFGCLKKIAANGFKRQRCATDSTDRVKVVWTGS
jgi:hypothetical protein